MNLENVRARVVSTHVASDLGRVDSLQRAASGQNDLPLCWARNDLATRIDYVAVASEIRSAEVSIALWQVFANAQTSGCDYVAACLRSESAR